MAPRATTDGQAALDALLAHAPVGLLLVDEDGRCARSSAALGCVEGTPLVDVLGPAAVALVGEAAAAGAPRAGRLADDGDVTAVPVAGGGTWLVLGDTTHRRAAEAASALVRSGARLADAVDPEAVLEALAEAAVPDLADWCVIHVVQVADAPMVAAVAHADPARRVEVLDLHRRFPSSDLRTVPEAVGTGRAVVLPDLSEEDLVAAAVSPEHHDALRCLGPRSAAVLPLIARGRVLGAVSLVFDRRSGRRYDDRLLVAAEALAAQAAVVLDNARLYEEQAEVARTLQRSLLPPELPVVEGLDLAVRYRPAGRANEVGGDFYDVVAAADGAWRLLVGDIAGKGAEAAALTSLVRHTLAAAALRDPGMEADLVLANDALRARTGASTFCTVAYASARRRGDGVDLSAMTAGHPPPLVVRAGGEVEPLVTRGPVLGVLRQVAFEAARAHLGPGDALVLYTDGAIELRGIPADEGEVRLREVLARAAGRPAAELLEHVEHHTLVLGGGAPRDDLALLALRVPV